MNKVIENIAKSANTMKAITSALIIDGIALKSETTAIFNPSFLDIIRSGLKTRSIRITLMNWIFKLLKIIEITEKMTMKKSITFHEILRYEAFPLKRKP